MDTPLNENVETTSCTPEPGNISTKEQNHKDTSQPLYNTSRIQIRRVPCTKCGTLTYREIHASEKPTCVECLSKETGHDDCTIENCTTCKEFVAKVTKVQF